MKGLGLVLSLLCLASFGCNDPGALLSAGENSPNDADDDDDPNPNPLGGDPIPAGEGTLGGDGSGVAWNPADTSSHVALSMGDLHAEAPDGTGPWGGARATAGKNSGKWYFEVTIDDLNADGRWNSVGVGTPFSSPDQGGGFSGYGCAYERIGNILCEEGNLFAAADSWQIGDVIGVAVDLDTNQIWFRRNGVWQNTAGIFLGWDPARAPFFPVATSEEGGAFTANFGATLYATPAPEGFASLTTGVDADLSQPSTRITNCVGSSWSTEAEGTALRALAVYETDGTPIVDVSPQDVPTVLVLSSYEPASWTVRLLDGATLERVVVTGYEVQSLTVTGGSVAEEVYSYESGDSLGDDAFCVTDIPYRGGGCNTGRFLNTIEAHTGVETTSIDTCYAGSTFVLD